MKKDDKRATSRPERVPLHKQRALTANAKAGYEQRWVNDLPGRIDRFLKAGWTVVNGESEVTHDGLAQVESQMGSGMRRVVNQGIAAPSRHAVLMQIPTEYYEADKAEQQKLINEKEDGFDQHGIHRKSGMYGGIKREDNTKSS